MIFIGYDYESRPISIVNAKTKELAYAYWQGAGIIPHSHKSIEEDFTDINTHITGVYPIMKTGEFTISELTHGNSSFAVLSKKILMIVK